MHTTPLSNYLVRSTVVVHAEEGVVDRVENAVGGAPEKVNDTALATNDKVQDATTRVVDFMSGKADEAHNVAEDVSRDVQRNVNKAVIASRDLEGNAKSASRDARSKVNNVHCCKPLNNQSPLRHPNLKLHTLWLVNCVDVLAI